jgi:hypothetical protein
LIYQVRRTNKTITVYRTYSGSDNHTKLAEIEFDKHSPPIIRYDSGRVDREEDFFSDGDLSSDERLRKRIFRAPDQREYVWKIHDKTELFLRENNRSKTRIAKFHRGHSGILHRSHPYLEVVPEGEHIVDFIFLTFVFVTSLRRHRAVSDARLQLEASQE